MMKRIFYSVSLLLFIIIASVHYSFAQVSEVLDINNVKVTIWNDGDLFWDKNGNPAFEYPAGSGKHATNLSGLWITGKDVINYAVGAVTYKRPDAIEFSDFQPGPLDTTCGSLIDSSTISVYNRFWKMYRQDIEIFRLCNCIDPTAPICAGYTIPTSIKEWPGNPVIEANGHHLLLSDQLAPYFDTNGDGVYNYNDCDYPLISGDMALFWVMNDQMAAHSVSGLPAMGVEVRCMAYASNCDNAIQDMIFVDYDIIPRCGMPVSDMFIGMYSEADAGNGKDDYVGTNVEEGYIYHYNADANDSIYGNNPVAMATVLVRGPRMNANGVDDELTIPAINALTDTTTISGAYGVNGHGFNDIAIDNEYLGYTRTMGFMDNGSVWGNPINGNHFYRYMRGHFKDGSRMRYGGFGYPTGPFLSAPEASYIYPWTSDPDDVGTKGVATSFDWAEYNSGDLPSTNVISERKFIASTGPINPAPNEHIRLTYAFVAAQGSGSDSLGLGLLQQKVDTLRTIQEAFFQPHMHYNYPGMGYSNMLCWYTAMGTGIEEAGDQGLQIYPNPGSGNVFVQLLNTGQADQLIITDLSGRVVRVIKPAHSEGVLNIDLSTLSSGIYVIEVRSGKNLMRKKYIKQ